MLTAERLIESIAKMLVDEPATVKVNTVIGERVTVLELKVAKSDLGKVIGKQGQTAQAMRTLLNAVTKKEGGAKSVLEILE